MANERPKQDDWPPLTVTRRALLVEGSDREFRRLIEDMVRFAAHLQTIRERLAARLAVTPPQFKIIMALVRSEVPAMTATALATRLGVSMPFIATETAKLERLGLLNRRRNPEDARSVLIELSQAGRKRVQEAAPLVRAVNDELFSPLSRAGMRELAATTRALLASSDKALDLLSPDGISAFGGSERGAARRLKA